MAEFRTDVESYVAREAVEAVVSPGVFERAPLLGIRYHAFVDPSGGSSDSMTLGIAHREGEVAILDAVREVRPPFSPESVVEDFAEVLRLYRITSISGDRYAGEWPREQFRKRGIGYEPAAQPKSRHLPRLVAEAEQRRGRLARQLPAGQSARLAGAAHIARRARQYRPSATLARRPLQRCGRCAAGRECAAAHHVARP
jgi:hypothetical protein